MVDIRSKKGLPAGWIKTELGDLCEVVRGGSPRPMGSPKYFNGDIPFIKISDVTKIKTKNIYDSDTKVNEAGSKKSRLLPKGSLILSNSGTICVPKFLGVDACIHDGFVSFLNLNNAVSKEYLFHFFHFIRPYIIQKHKQGVTQVNLNTKIVSEFDLLLPPAEEQHRIVSKIEELFSELDNGIENLKKAREQLKTYRQAVLKYAFEGKLTKEWRSLHRRAGNPPEPAEKLLEQIKTEREKHYQKQMEDWKRACELAKADGRKKSVKPKKPDFYPALTKKEILDFPLLPHSWCWEKIGNLCQSIVPNRDKPKTFTGNIPWLTTPDLDLQKITVNLNLINKRLSKQEINKYNARLIPENSVIMTCVGTFGVTCINNKQCVINQQLHAFITHKFINSLYIAYALKFKEKYMEQNSTSTTISYLNKTKCNSLPIPICATDEQKAIVEEIESRLSVCDKIEQTVEDSFKKAEALRQSILKKAFLGELTRDWREKHPELITGENSAEKLLEKIKTEKALAAGRKKPRSKKAKKK